MIVIYNASQKLKSYMSFFSMLIQLCVPIQEQQRQKIRLYEC